MKHQESVGSHVIIKSEGSLSSANADAKSFDQRIKNRPWIISIQGRLVVLRSAGNLSEDRFPINVH